MVFLSFLSFTIYVTCVDPESHGGGGGAAVLAGHPHAVAEDGDVCGGRVEEALLEAGGAQGGHGPGGQLAQAQHLAQLRQRHPGCSDSENNPHKLNPDSLLVCIDEAAKN